MLDRNQPHTRYCIVPDPILEDGTMSDVAEVYRPDDPRLPIVLGRTGIESTPVFSTSWTWERLSEEGHADDAQLTGERVFAAPGWPVEPEPDPYT